MAWWARPRGRRWGYSVRCLLFLHAITPINRCGIWACPSRGSLAAGIQVFPSPERRGDIIPARPSPPLEQNRPFFVKSRALCLAYHSLPGGQDTKPCRCVCGVQPVAASSVDVPRSTTFRFLMSIHPSGYPSRSPLSRLLPLLGATVLLSPIVASAQGAGRVVGIVRDGATGTPLKGATVTLRALASASRRS